VRVDLHILFMVLAVMFVSVVICGEAPPLGAHKNVFLILWYNHYVFDCLLRFHVFPARVLVVFECVFLTCQSRGHSYDYSGYVRLG